MSNMNDKTNVPDTELVFEILNVYTSFFNTYYSTNDNLFVGINADDVSSTNVQLEKLYECIHAYKNSDDKEKLLSDPSDVNIKDTTEMYCVCVDGHVLKICQLLYPLLEYVAMNIDWKNVNWKIIHHEIS